MNPVEPNWLAIPGASSTEMFFFPKTKKAANEVPAEIESLTDIPDSEPAIEELTPV